MPTLSPTAPISIARSPGRALHPAFGPPAGTGLPLQGLTLLAVEDSRFAADALRLMAQRSGARLRRADSLMAARSHLRVYRPDVVLVDLGLPDGRGEDLIADLVRAPSRPNLILGMSGDPMARDAALRAGADAFVDKPIPGLLAFQRLILAPLGNQGDGAAAADTPKPDPMALTDDLRQALDWLATPHVRARPGYLIGFVAGLARHAGDAGLLAAATGAQDGADGLDRLSDVIAARLVATDAQQTGFGPHGGTHA
jgi:CheY-like chemotaxis protein